MVLIRTAHMNRRQASDGRIPRRIPESDFLLVKCVIVLRCRACDRVMVGKVCLNQYQPLPVRAPRASGRLRQQLESTLPRGIIRDIQRQVRHQDSHQCDVREVMSLDDHLCTDQNVRFMACERG